MPCCSSPWPLYTPRGIKDKTDERNRPPSSPRHIGRRRHPRPGLRDDGHPATAKHRADYRGQPYFFCSAGCKTKFTADPRKYLGHSARPRTGGRRRDLHLPDASADPAERPGACPICGMALEPEMPSADTGPNPELADMTRRFWIGARSRVAGDGHGNGRPFRPRIGSRPPSQIGFSSPSPRRWCCGRAGRSSCAAGQSLVTRNLNMFTLIAHGHRRRLSLQPGRDIRARAFSPPSADGRRGRGLFRGRRRHHCLGVARARCWNCGRARRPAARSARCSISRPRPRAAYAPTARRGNPA